MSEKIKESLQNCSKSDTVLDKYCMQLTSADTAQNKCIDSDVSDIQLPENMINESILISFKEECYEDLHAFDDNQYYLESTITIDEHELSPVDFEIKLELKQEANFNVGDISTAKDEIMVSEFDRDLAENVQMDPIAGTSGENNLSFCSDVPNDAKNRADNCNMNSADSLTKHQSIKSGKRLKKRCIKCGICSKTFTRFGYLKQHEMIHSGVHPYECKLCNKKFNHSSNLKKHEMIHSGVRPYECKLCNKKFTQAGDLKTHERIHSGVRPYECKLCNKKFNHSSSLKKHERKHSGIRPYECKLSNKKFTESGVLKKHERIHSGERSFECKLCNKKFTDSGHLKRHESVHSSNPS